MVKKKGCWIFSKRQVALWRVRKRRWFLWLWNSSIHQSWALQKWHLALFCFSFQKTQDKVLIFKTGSGKPGRIPGIPLIPRKVGTSNSENMLTYLSWRSNSVSSGVVLQANREKAGLLRFDTTTLSCFSLFLPQGPSLSMLSVLK